MTDYLALRKWNAELGASPDYVRGMVDKARADGAPADAIYKRDHIGGDGAWRTVSDLASDHPFRVRYDEAHSV